MEIEKIKKLQSYVALVDNKLKKLYPDIPFNVAGNLSTDAVVIRFQCHNTTGLSVIELEKSTNININLRVCVESVIEGLVESANNLLGEIKNGNNTQSTKQNGEAKDDSNNEAENSDSIAEA